MKKINSVSFLIVGLYLFLLPTTANAALPPNFPTCATPTGTLKVQYNSGTHGIAGNSNVFVGSDSVYSLVDGNALQCFCAEDGSGIQTDWWKVTSITQAERQVLESQGWHYIPDGSAWGLANTVYMAKNNNYACRGGNSSNNSSSVAGASSSLSGGTSNGVGQVLGLATTGSMNAIVTILSLGLGLLSAGLLMKNIKKG
jgi:hypothetical protein